MLIRATFAAVPRNRKSNWFKGSRKTRVLCCRLLLLLWISYSQLFSKLWEASHWLHAKHTGLWTPFKLNWISGHRFSAKCLRKESLNETSRTCIRKNLNTLFWRWTLEAIVTSEIKCVLSFITCEFLICSEDLFSIVVDLWLGSATLLLICKSLRDPIQREWNKARHKSCPKT